jgi:hypothetical protein
MIAHISLEDKVYGGHGQFNPQLGVVSPGPQYHPDLKTKPRSPAFTFGKPKSPTKEEKSASPPPSPPKSMFFRNIAITI